MVNRWLGLQFALFLVTDYTSFTAHPAWNVFKNLERVRASGRILLPTASWKHLQMIDMMDNGDFQNKSLDEVSQRKEKRKQSLKRYLISGPLNLQWSLCTSHQAVLTTGTKRATFWRPHAPSSSLFHRRFKSFPRLPPFFQWEIYLFLVEKEISFLDM